MTEKVANNLLPETQKFQKSLTQMLEDFKIDTKEAHDLMKKYDLEKKEILQFSQDQLSLLKIQFWEDISDANFWEYIENLASKYLDTRKPNKELLYDGITDFADFQESWAQKVDIKNPQKPQNISDENWVKAQELLKVAQKSGITEGEISFTKENGVVLELDTSGSNLYIKLDGNNIVVTGQNDGQFFVESVSQEDFESFVKNYDNVEFKRVLEMIGFTGGLTLGWILSFSLRTGIGWILGYLWTGFWVYRGYQVFKSYQLSKNEALSVLKENKNNPELVKNYLYLSQVWYIVWYENGSFETIDGEKLTGEKLAEKEQNMEPSKYQLLRWLKDKWFKPKYISNGKYELDMAWLFDRSPLTFVDGKVQFSTTYFEKWMNLEFWNVEEAFSKIQKINEYISLETQLKNQSNNESFHFQNQTEKMEKKLEKMKWEILQKIVLTKSLQNITS